MSLSHIQTSTLWKTSGRWDHAGKEVREIFFFVSFGKTSSFVLGDFFKRGLTFTQLISSFVYQIEKRLNSCWHPLMKKRSLS